jgi:mRNA-degrading endonuclease HigB of HigAB toxin-antitoxin module
MFPKWDHRENQMRFVGQMEVAAFLGDHPKETDRLQAWLAEIKHRNWDSAEALSADFPNLEASKPPLTVFRLGDAALRVETIIDFRNRVVVLRTIQELAPIPRLTALQHGNS